MAPDKLEEMKALTCMWLAELPAGSVSLLLATSATLMPAAREPIVGGYQGAAHSSCGPFPVPAAG